jgi:hypothetical protein
MDADMKRRVVRQAKGNGAEEKDGELLRKGMILKEGISAEALEVLKELCGYELPVFQFRDPKTGLNLTENAETLTLMAAVRDGERGLVQTVLKLRALAGGKD